MRTALDLHDQGNKPGFQKGERVWLCLTSLWHRRYVEDVIHIVGMPFGTRVRLRYRKEYVEIDLWNRVLNDMALGRVVVLIALLDSQAADPLRATPLRRCRLAGVSCQGSVLVMDVTLEEFMIVSHDRDAFWEEVVAVGRNLPKPGAPGLPPQGDFLQELKGAPGGVLRNGSIQAWECIAESVLAIDDEVNCAHSRLQRQISFLYLIAGLNQELKRSLSKRGSLTREGGFSFSLDVHTLTRESAGKIINPIGEVYLEVSHPVASFISSRRVRIDSQRDVKTIQLATSAVFRRAYGHLSVRSVHFEYPTGDAEENAAIVSTARGSREATTRISTGPLVITTSRREEVVVARYDFSLVVGRILPWVACAMVALAAAIGVYEAPDDRSASFGDYLQSMVVFVLAFVGLVIGLRGEND